MNLPDLCYAIHPSTGDVVLIRRDQRGFYSHIQATPGVDSLAIRDQLNERLGVTPEQVEAMTCGSMFGWTAPAADPNKHSADYRAYDTATEWSGPRRMTLAEASSDADRHNRGCEDQGGYGSAIVVRRWGSRMLTLDGTPVYPPHGQSCGAVCWDR